MTTPRFTVYAQTGYDFGHLASRPRGIVGQFDDLAAARKARDEHNAQHFDSNSGAAFVHASISDALNEHAVLGFGYYGDGTRITRVVSLLDVAASDDVLFRGSRQECEAFKAPALGDTTVRIKVGAVIANDIQNRLPDDLPVEKLQTPGTVALTIAEARALLADAEFNSDPTCVDVGPHAMPRATFNAYKRLRDTLRATLATH